MYPEVTETTPFNSWKTASTHQKHPAPSVMVSILARLITAVPAGVSEDALSAAGWPEQEIASRPVRKVAKVGEVQKRMGLSEQEVHRKCSTGRRHVQQFPSDAFNDAHHQCIAHEEG
ncbi:MAG TPA: hypothetical protein PLN54_08545, partial [Flavobacteriales bacterium]|nr:hypothetical protein [Flavobacteriales bacterium]